MRGRYGMIGRRGFGIRRRGFWGWRRPFRWPFGPFMRPFAGPFTWRRGRWARWLMMGPAMLLLFGGAAAYKLQRDDARRIETATGKSATDLTEEELLAAMKKLGIQKLELNEEDKAAVSQAS
jgi:hypothetical protein